MYIIFNSDLPLDYTSITSGLILLCDFQVHVVHDSFMIKFYKPYYVTCKTVLLMNKYISNYKKYSKTQTV